MLGGLPDAGVGGVADQAEVVRQAEPRRRAQPIERDRGVETPRAGLKGDRWQQLAQAETIPRGRSEDRGGAVDLEHQVGAIAARGRHQAAEPHGTQQLARSGDGRLRKPQADVSRLEQQALCESQVVALQQPLGRQRFDGLKAVLLVEVGVERLSRLGRC